MFETPYIDLNTCDERFFRTLMGISAKALNETIDVLTTPSAQNAMPRFLRAAVSVVQEARDQIDKHPGQPPDLEHPAIALALMLRNAMDDTYSPLNGGAALGKCFYRDLKAISQPPGSIPNSSVDLSELDASACDYLLGCKHMLKALDSLKIENNRPSAWPSGYKSFIAQCFCNLRDAPLLSKLFDADLNWDKKFEATIIRPNSSLQSVQYSGSLYGRVAISTNAPGIHCLVRDAKMDAEPIQKHCDQILKIWMGSNFGYPNSEMEFRSIFKEMLAERKDSNYRNLWSMHSLIADLYKSASDPVAAQFMSLILCELMMASPSKKTDEIHHKETLSFLWDLSSATLEKKLQSVKEDLSNGSGHEILIMNLLDRSLRSCNLKILSHFELFIPQLVADEIMSRERWIPYDDPAQLLLSSVAASNCSPDLNDFQKCVEIVMRHGVNFEGSVSRRKNAPLLHRLAASEGPQKLGAMMVLIETAGLDPDQKDERNWKPSSHLEATDRARFASMLKAKDARMAASDAMTELLGSP